MQIVYRQFDSSSMTLVRSVNPSYSSSCRSGEIWTECVNPCNTCEYKGFVMHRLNAKRAAIANLSITETKTGFCVPLDLCKAKPMKCPTNALYVPCAPPTIPSCENPYSEQDYEYDCIPGCICKPGFLKRKDSTCVPASQCYAPEVPPGQENLSAQCPKNAIFIQCGSPCPPTCDDLQPEPCEEKCTTACYCKPGYLKRKDGICVIPEDCHPRNKEKIPQVKCPENAIFIQCGSPCPPTCENRQPEPCEEKCTSACYCKPGYLKSKEDKCVKPEKNVLPLVCIVNLF
ncbi:uncharacterized protein CEXT_780771 [Caerostris extrusa]|uniref:TIL domain-containing protein n=1 Tax=Caerostris extrusa TaxID=172846 RepID=A0AAV4XE05_CAEEX|nr:uncharacterized protein CEXT_780771 [Caerostris extrusa]